jgi:hypothetical protein
MRNRQQTESQDTYNFEGDFYLSSEYRSFREQTWLHRIGIMFVCISAMNGSNRWGVRPVCFAPYLEPDTSR